MSQVHDARSRPRSVLLWRVIDSLDDGGVVSDLDGRCLLSNPAARRLFATDFADVPAAEWTSVFGCLLPDMVTPYPPQDMPLSRTLRGEVVSNLELFMVNLWAPQGMWLSVNGTPIRDPHGKIEGGVVVVRDITRIKHKIQQIELLSNVVEATADAVIVTDRGGRIEYVNPAFETATGYTRAEVLGRNPSMLKSGAHGREFYAGLWRTLVEGRVFRGTLINRNKSGELFFTEQTITPVRKPGGEITHVVSVGKDVTQLRRAAERESTLLLARSVQQRLFPSHAPLVPGFDIFGATFVADVTGGDYYDFIPLPDERLGILVADVSGHGVDSALLMAETRAVLRATAQTTSEPSGPRRRQPRAPRGHGGAPVRDAAPREPPPPLALPGLLQRGPHARLPSGRPWRGEERAVRHRPASGSLPRLEIRDALPARGSRRHPGAPDGRRDGLRHPRGGAFRRRAGARGDPIVSRRTVLGCRRGALPRGSGLRRGRPAEGRRHDRGCEASPWDLIASVHALPSAGITPQRPSVVSAGQAHGPRAIVRRRDDQLQTD